MFWRVLIDFGTESWAQWGLIPLQSSLRFTICNSCLPFCILPTPTMPNKCLSHQSFQNPTFTLPKATFRHQPPSFTLKLSLLNTIYNNRIPSSMMTPSIILHKCSDHQAHHSTSLSSTVAAFFPSSPLSPRSTCLCSYSLVNHIFPSSHNCNHPQYMNSASKP